MLKDISGNNWLKYPVPVIDVLSEGLGNLGYTFLMNSLLSTDAKKRILPFSRSPQQISLQDCHPSKALEVLLPSLMYLSSPIPCNKSPTQKKARNPSSNVLFGAWIFSLLLITNYDLTASEIFYIWNNVFYQDLKYMQLARWGVILPGLHV